MVEFVKKSPTKQTQVQGVWSHPTRGLQGILYHCHVSNLDFRSVFDEDVLNLYPHSLRRFQYERIPFRNRWFTYHWNIPRDLKHLFMKGILSYLDFAYGWGLLEFSKKLGVAPNRPLLLFGIFRF